MTRTERLDALPFTKEHGRLLVGSGIGWALDAMDVGLISFVIAALAKDPHWMLTPQSQSWILSAGFVGMAIGATVGGLLADRIGRRHVFALTLLIYGIATGASALAASLAVLIALRFIVGLGLGAELPVASTLVSEYSPKRIRGRIVVFLEAFWAVGWITAAVIGTFVIPLKDNGWRWALALGGIPAVYALVVRFGLPESVRFLESRGRYAEAERAVQKFESSALQSVHEGISSFNMPSDAHTGMAAAAAAAAAADATGAGDGVGGGLGITSPDSTIPAPVAPNSSSSSQPNSKACASIFGNSSTLSANSTRQAPAQCDGILPGSLNSVHSSPDAVHLGDSTGPKHFSRPGHSQESARPKPITPTSPNGHVGALWSRPLRKRTALIWTVWFCINLAYYGAFLWIPSLLVAQGFTLTKSFAFTLIITLAQIPGYALAAWAIERCGRRATLAAFLLGSMVSAVAFAFASSDAAILAAGMLLSFSNLGAWGALYAITPEIYPTIIRGTGSGAAAGFGRLASIISPLIVPPILAWGNGFGTRVGDLALFALFGAAFLIAALASWGLPDLRGRSLETIEGPQSG